MLLTPQNRFGRQFAAYTATRFTDVELTGTGESVDRLISLRFPSYALKHPSHVCWLNHRMREYYDLWNTWYPGLSWKGKIKERVRRNLIHKADHYFLTGNLKKLFAQSKNIQKGLLQWGNIPSEVLYPPAPQREYRTEAYEDFILSPSRLTPLKRVTLLVEALAQCKNGRAVILGEGPDRGRIENLIREKGLSNRVRMLGHVDDRMITDLYSGCRAVYYAPQFEDYGLVTLEAFHCRKPVITALDSGGPAELVENGVSGFVVEPNPESVADALTRIIDDSALAEKYGTAGYEACKHITWDHTVSQLLK
jgi:glycosyltransferase involved in cell wall biosynthesis